MPNWCSTGITFYSEDAMQVTAMQKHFHEIIVGKPTEENGFGHGWMGDFANTFFPEIGAEKIDCRGIAEEYEYNVQKKDKYYYFRILTETAWGAKIGLWYEIVKNFYPDVLIAYCAEECGNAYYVKWDGSEGRIFYSEEYCVEYCLPNKNGGIEYADNRKYSFQSIADMHKYFDEILPFPYKHYVDAYMLVCEIQEQLDAYSSSHSDILDDLFISIEKFELVAPCEFGFLI